jgi:lipopolysaccharide export system permease protein
MRSRRGHAMVGLGTSLVVVLAYYALHAVCLALGKGGLLPAFLAAWLANLLFAGAGIYLIRHSA